MKSIKSGINWQKKRQTCIGFVSLYVHENEKEGTESDPCLGKDTQLQHRQDLKFMLRIKESWYFLFSSATFLFFKYNTLPPGYEKREV